VGYRVSTVGLDDEAGVQTGIWEQEKPELDEKSELDLD
jgi:hypothetical protein